MLRLLTSLVLAVPIALVPAPQRVAPTAQGATALDRYVAAADPTFAWKVVKDLPAEGATATLIEMTSQRWLTEQEVERVTAELRMVPNQPVVFTDDPTHKPRSEDDFILTLPKFMVNASGDQFFLPDSSQFYFDALRGEKHVRYVANASHSMDKTDALESVQAFYASVVAGRPRPQIRWTFERDGSIKVVARDRPQTVVVRRATNPDARDFRQEQIGNAYTSAPLEPSGPNTWVARVPAPPTGWTAFVVEMTFASGGRYPFKETSGIRVLPDTLPYAPFKPDVRSQESGVGSRSSVVGRRSSVVRRSTMNRPS